jgi:hypothetical protein
LSVSYVRFRVTKPNSVYRMEFRVYKAHAFFIYCHIERYIIDGLLIYIERNDGEV